MTFNKRRNILYLEQKTYTCTLRKSKENIVLELDEGKVFTTFQKGNQYEKVENIGNSNTSATKVLPNRSKKAKNVATAKVIRKMRV